MINKEIVADCGIPPPLDNGSYTASETVVGSVGNVSCDVGFDPSDSFIMCESTGIWTTSTCLIRGNLVRFSLFQSFLNLIFYMLRPQ